MIVIDVMIGRGVSLSNDALDLLEAFELFDPAFLLNLERLDIFAARRWVVEDALLYLPDVLDVVLDPLETFEVLEVVVHLPGVVQVTVALPLDEEAQVGARVIVVVVLCDAAVMRHCYTGTFDRKLTMLAVAFVIVDTVDRVFDIVPCMPSSMS